VNLCSNECKSKKRDLASTSDARDKVQYKKDREGRKYEVCFHNVGSLFHCFFPYSTCTASRRLKRRRLGFGSTIRDTCSSVPAARHKPFHVDNE